MTRVLIAAESSISHRGLEAVVSGAPSFEIVGASHGTEDLAQEIEDLQPDVVLFERSSFDHGVLAEILALIAPGEESETARIVLLTDQVTVELARQALRAGVRAILSRDAAQEEIIAAIEAAAAGLIALNPETIDAAFPVPANGLRSASNGASGSIGRPHATATALSPREIEVLQMIAEGLGNKEIASRLKISEHTVKFHVSSIFTKLDVSSRTEAVTLGVRLGVILL